MELLERQDPEKKRLIETSERHKRALEKEVSEISEKTSKVMTNALIIGGTLALSYIVISQITKRRAKSKKAKKEKYAPVPVQEVHSSVEADPRPSTPNMFAEIGTRVLNEATIVLVDIARQKLMEYLQRRKGDDAS